MFTLWYEPSILSLLYLIGMGQFEPNVPAPAAGLNFQYVCSHCNQYFTKYALVKHLEKH